MRTRTGKDNWHIRHYFPSGARTVREEGGKQTQAKNKDPKDAPLFENQNKKGREKRDKKAKEERAKINLTFSSQTSLEKSRVRRAPYEEDQPFRGYHHTRKRGVPARSRGNRKHTDPRTKKNQDRKRKREVRGWRTPARRFSMRPLKKSCESLREERREKDMGYTGHEVDKEERERKLRSATSRRRNTGIRKSTLTL